MSAPHGKFLDRLGPIYLNQFGPSLTADVFKEPYLDDVDSRPGSERIWEPVSSAGRLHAVVLRPLALIRMLPLSFDTDSSFDLRRSFSRSLGDRAGSAKSCCTASSGPATTGCDLLADDPSLTTARGRVSTGLHAALALSGVCRPRAVHTTCKFRDPCRNNLVGQFSQASVCWC